MYMDCLAHFLSYNLFYTLEECTIELGICQYMWFIEISVLYV